MICFDNETDAIYHPIQSPGSVPNLSYHIVLSIERVFQMKDLTKLIIGAATVAVGAAAAATAVTVVKKKKAKALPETAEPETAVETEETEAEVEAEIAPEAEAAEDSAED